MLSSKARNDLNVAVLEYLSSASYSSAAAAFKKEAGLEDAAIASPVEGQSTNLERKWNAILRLQKRVEELEAQVTDLSASAKTAEKKARGGEIVAHDFYPRDLSFALAGHRKQITALAGHPLFDVVVSGSEDAAIRLWDTSSGVCERTLTGHTGAVNDLAFEALTGSGLLLASCSNDSTLKLWDFGWAAGGGSGSAAAASASDSATGSTTGTPLPSSSPGTTGSAAAVGAPTAKPATYACLRTLHGHDGPVLGVAFVPRTSTLLSCSRDGTIGFWDCESGHCLKKISEGVSAGGSADWLRRIAVNQGGSMAVTCSNEKHLSVWDLSAGRVTRAIHGHENTVECIALSSPAMDLALRKAIRGAARAAAGGGIASPAASATPRGLNFSSPSPGPMQTPGKAPLSGGSTFFSTPASAGGAAAPATPRIGGAPGQPAVADAPAVASNIAGTLSIATAIAGLSLSGQQGGLYIASGSRDRSVRVFESTSGVEIACFGAEEHEGWVRSVMWHPTCVGWLVSACEDRCIRVLDVVKKAVVRRLPDAIWDSLLSCAILRSPSVAGPPALIVGGSEATIQVWSCK
jgi:platelet-activating factor acetylhydrolase IB subunit alpha